MEYFLNKIQKAPPRGFHFQMLAMKMGNLDLQAQSRLVN